MREIRALRWPLGMTLVAAPVLSPLWNPKDGRDLILWGGGYLVLIFGLLFRRFNKSKARCRQVFDYWFTARFRNKGDQFFPASLDCLRSTIPEYGHLSESGATNFGLFAVQMEPGA